MTLKPNKSLVRQIPFGHLGFYVLLFLGRFCESLFVRRYFLNHDGLKRRGVLGWGSYSRISTAYKLVAGLNAESLHSKLEGFGEVNSEIKTDRQSVKRGSNHNPVSSASCDFLIVGAGPGGLAAAKELIQAGFDVLVVESGSGYNIQSPNCTLQDVMESNWVNFGRNYLKGKPNITLLQGQGIGGSSAISGMIIHRLSQLLLEQVASYLCTKDFPITASELRVLEDKWYATLNISQSLPIFDKETAGRFGSQIKSMPRAVKGCRDSGLCLMGCPNEGKNSLDQRLFRELKEASCRFLFNHKVKFVDSNSLAVFIASTAPTSSYNQEVLTARCGIILAAGAIETPRLVLRSNIDVAQAGVNLALNLGPSSAFVYPDSRISREKLSMGLEFFHQSGIKFSTQSLPVELLAARVWPFSLKPSQNFANLEKISIWTATIASSGNGKVFKKNRGFQVGSYQMSELDHRNFLIAIETLQDLGKELGARQIFPLTESLGSSHIFGTMSYSGPRIAPQIFSTDSSVLPLATGINPILAIMTVSSAITRQIIKETKPNQPKTL